MTLVERLRSGSLSQKVKLEAADRIEALEQALSEIDDCFSDALQSDLENGVRWLNEQAAHNFKTAYPELNAALAFMRARIDALLTPPTAPTSET